MRTRQDTGARRPMTGIREARTDRAPPPSGRLARLPCPRSTRLRSPSPSSPRRSTTFVAVDHRELEPAAGEAEDAGQRVVAAVGDAEARAGSRSRSTGSRCRPRACRSRRGCQLVPDRDQDQRCAVRLSERDSSTNTSARRVAASPNCLTGVDRREPLLPALARRPRSGDPAQRGTIVASAPRRAARRARARPDHGAGDDHDDHIRLLRQCRARGRERHADRDRGRGDHVVER